MTADEPMSTPDSRGLREAVEALCDPFSDGPRPYAVNIDGDVVLAVGVDELREAIAAHPFVPPAEHGVAWEDRLNIICQCGQVCSADMGKSPTPLLGSKSDYYVRKPAAQAFAQHLIDVRIVREKGLL